MAIQDRNLSVGTKLYARYKGQTHTAEVVLNPEATGDRPIGYKVEGKAQLFKSPSAAGTAITEKACNGWACWSVGDAAESTGPVTSTRPGGAVTIMLEITVERVSGKFASKDDVANDLLGLVDGQNIYVDESEYEVTDVSVYEPKPVKPPRR